MNINVDPSTNALLSHLHLDALPQYVHLLCNSTVEDEVELFMITAWVTRIEGDWYFHRSTRGQNIWLEVKFQVRAVLELALDTEEEEHRMF